MTRTRLHTHCIRGCLKIRLEAGCSITKIPRKATTKQQTKAALEAMQFAAATHGLSSNPRGANNDLKVEGREIETHVEHLIPCQFTKPFSSPRKIETRCVLDTNSIANIVALLTMHATGYLHPIYVRTCECAKTCT